MVGKTAIAPHSWQIMPNFAPDAWLVDFVGEFAAQILAQRGIRPQQLRLFCSQKFMCKLVTMLLGDGSREPMGGIKLKI